MENMDKGLTAQRCVLPVSFPVDCTKMDADSLAENTENDPEFICSICLPKPQKFWISLKKGFIGRP